MRPLVQSAPLRCALRVPVLPARMKFISACLSFKSINQQRARVEILKVDHVDSRLEVLARLLVIPSASPRRQTLQPIRRPDRMAGIAARVALTPGKEDRLHSSLEKFEIERRLRHHCSRGRDHQKNQSHRTLHGTIHDTLLWPLLGGRSARSWYSRLSPYSCSFP